MSSIVAHRAHRVPHVNVGPFPRRPTTAGRTLSLLLLSALAGCGARVDATGSEDAPDRQAPGAAPLSTDDLSGAVEPGFGLEEELNSVGSRCLSRPLSPVGVAMSAIPEIGARRSQCIALPYKWLYSIDYDTDTFEGFADDVGAQLRQTKTSFSHASLRYHPRYNFSDLLVKLHIALAPPRGGVLPDEKKPILRFMFGDQDVLEAADGITAGLRSEVGRDARLWNVKIAVKEASFGVLNGWNHTKLNIRDGVDVFASSIEVRQYELGIHLAGLPAQHAKDWFDVIWTSDAGVCIPYAPDLCEATPPSLPRCWSPASNPAAPTSSRSGAGSSRTPAGGRTTRPTTPSSPAWTAPSDRSSSSAPA
jgi:hypothetical protein